ncbi:MAG: hypothetical protein ACE5HR_00050 [bacterium]
MSQDEMVRDEFIFTRLSSGIRLNGNFLWSVESRDTGLTASGVTKEAAANRLRKKIWKAIRV